MNAQAPESKVRLRLPEIGQVLAARYRIDSRLNAGTYGVVYAATDQVSGQSCAVKCLLPSAASSPAVVRRFQREVAVIRELTHPNFVTILDFGFAEQCLFYVMELLNGVDLGSRLQQGAFSPRGAALIASQVLLALAEAHRHDIVHRDLKPENLFIQSAADGRVRIRVIDFGIAKIVGERGENAEKLTLVNEACGTPNYMAPEQIISGTVGPWTDIYALALILFEMLTGQVAIKGETFLDTLRLQTTFAPRLPEALADLPYADVLYKALAKKPAERFQSADEMNAALLASLGA